MLKSESIAALALGQRVRAWDIGKKGHDTYEWCACNECGKERWVIVTKGRVGSGYCLKCGLKNFNQSRRGDKSPCWKGGKRISNGYVYVYLPDGTKFDSMRFNSPGRSVLEHRLVMAKHLDRPLNRFEIVHHKDGNRSNNRIENLELTALGEHSKEHSYGYVAGFLKGYLDGLKKGDCYGQK